MTDHDHDCHAIATAVLLVRLEVVLVQRLDGDLPMILAILDAMRDEELDKAA